jgi:hypothetical protein
MAAKQADIRACGGPNWISYRNADKADACMNAHGWMIDHVVPHRHFRREDPQ